MKRFVDYNPTIEEIIQIFGTDEEYKFVLTRFAQYPEGDYEKRKISRLLFLRGEKEESRKMIETIADEEYRGECEQDYDAWEGMEEGVWVN